MRHLIFTISFLLISATSWCQSVMTTGQWRGIIEYEDEDVPFEFLVDDNLQVIIKNGDERIIIKDAVLEEDSILIPLKPFDAWIKAKLGTHELLGYWKKGYRKKGVPFRATYGAPRFKRSSNIRSKKFIGKWQVELSSPSRIPYPAVLVIEEKRAKIIGTFLTEVGDFRFFEGIINDDSIMMSSYDGAHAFLFKGVIHADSLNGELHMDNGYSEMAKGVKNDNASITEPFKLIEPGHRPFFDILSAGDASVKIDEDDFFDKVIVLQLFGTWCPNSMDQTNFLSEWYENKPEGVEVIAATFEPNFSTAYGNKRIAQYKKDMGLNYNITLGGKLNKRQAALSLPYADEINAFPTLVLIDKDGFVRYEFSYFQGPATGSYHQQFVDKFNTCIEELLRE